MDTTSARKKRVALLYRNGFFSLPATLATSIVFAIVLWDHLPWGGMAFWFASLWLITLWRGLLVLRYRAATPAKREEGHWYRSFLLGGAMGGIVWGGGGAFFLQTVSGLEQFFVLLSLAGVAAVGAHWLAPMRHAARFNISAVLLPPSLALLDPAEPMYHSLGMLLLIYLAMLLLAASRTTTMIEALTQETQPGEALLRKAQKANRQPRPMAQRHDAARAEQYRDESWIPTSYDHLTGLSNRVLFNERLQPAMAEAGRRGRLFGLLLIDLDHFTRINEIFGHATGDRLLCNVAERLNHCLRDSDILAHLGGDKFAIMLPEVRQAADSEKVARKLLSAVAEPYWIDDREIIVTASIGIALHPNDTTDGHQLHQYADSAMHHAKEKGRNQFRFYSTAITTRNVERLTLEAQLRRAEMNGELELYYQPQINLSNGELSGMEALLRWNHPEQGVITPDRFIGIAEDTGLIVSIGEWVLRQACLDVREWNHSHGRNLRMAVNLSTRQFKGNDLVSTIRRFLEESGCLPQWLELEITESLLLEESPHVRAMLEGLRDMGVTIAIDDFGTGYSALGYLKRFPVEKIKLDRSFVHDIISNRDSAELTKGIISLARNLHLQLVAEGVENVEQRAFLSAHGCQLAQGYLFGRPIPARQFEALLIRTA